MHIFLPQINPKLSVQKIFVYDPTFIHNTSVTDRQTDGRETDDYGNIDAYSIAVI